MEKVLSRRLSFALAEIGPDRLGRALVFICLSFAVAFAWLLAPVETLKPLLLGLAAGLFAMSASALVGMGLNIARKTSRLRRAKHRIPDMDCAAVLTERDGMIADLNAKSKHLTNAAEARNIAHLLQSELANPDNVVRQMIRLAETAGGARRELASGRMLRLVADQDDFLLWTIEDAPEVEATTSLPVVRLGNDGTVLSFNTSAQRIFGPHSGLLAKQFTELDARTGRVETLKTQDGEVRVTLVASPDADGQCLVTLVPQVSNDGTPHNGSLLAQPGLLETLPVPMLKIAADGTLIEANTEARAIFNLQEGHLTPLFELVEGMGRPISDWLNDAAEGRGLLRPEIVRAVVPGQELFLQIALGRMTENNETVLVGILNDATELKTLEAQFVQSQKMQAIGQLAGGVAHDFNNLLTAISGHCDLLLLRHDPGDPEYADLIQISQNSNRAASLVGQLLAFSRKQNLKPQSLDIRDTMSDLAHLLNRLIGERIQLNVTHDLGPQVIRADRRQLEQVIVNLVVNARDAMPEGGTINVRTRPEFLNAETMRDRARLTPGSYVVIEVEDTGSGISPEGLSKIFEPFYTTKKTGEGTGLGLSTAYGIVKQTGGYIFVESELDVGTTFSLYFRASQKIEPEVEREAPTEDRMTPGDGVVLLVEDEAPVRAFAARALRLRGYTVVEAECAEDAIELLSDESLFFDIFVTDVIMPGMDGPTWVRKALKQRPDTPVIFMSGYAEEGRAEKQARIPNSSFLPKPFSLRQLTSLVQEKLQ